MTKLDGLHPELIERIARVLDAMHTRGAPMKITDGVRTAAQQVLLYSKGRTAPGKVVTYCDGLRLKSNHQQKADGFGYAVDCAFVGPEPYAESHPWEAYGEALERFGLAWGGRWSPHPDRPHAELRAEHGDL